MQLGDKSLRTMERLVRAQVRMNQPAAPLREVVNEEIAVSNVG
jgi:hypothetical protein